MHFIGIDGGGTNTKWVFTNEKLNLISSFETGASNPLAIGFTGSSKIISDIICRTCFKSSIKENFCVVAGIAGCGNKSNAGKLKKMVINRLKRSKLYPDYFEIISDAEIALEGALNGKPGAVLILGTGSIVIGKNEFNEIFKIGGYGKLIGDEGSGYSIGRKGLQAAAKCFDNRSSNTILTEYLFKKFGIVNRETMIKKVYSNKIDIASIAQLVFKSAENGDHICKKILDSEIKEVLLHIKVLQRFIKLGKIQLAFTGGITSNYNYFGTRLKKEINNRFKNIKIITAKHPSEIGAVIIAKKFYKLTEN